MKFKYNILFHRQPDNELFFITLCSAYMSYHISIGHNIYVYVKH